MPRFHNYLVQPKTRDSTYSYYPTDLTQIYNLPSEDVSGPRKRIAVMSFGGGMYGNLDSNGILTNGDCHKLWQKLNVHPMPIVKVKLLRNATNDVSDVNSSIENILDVTMIGCQCANSEITIYIAGNYGTNYVNMLNTMMADEVQYISISWGFHETPQDKDFVEQINGVFEQCAQRGMNIAAACGDNLANDNTNSKVADFPASSPWVLASGGTKLWTTGNTYKQNTIETVWNDGNGQGTGGGVSMFFTKPSFQNNIHLSNMRMIPDVSACADGQNSPIRIVFNDQEILIGGTSAVSPFFVGFMARIGLQKSILPMLYAAPATCFHDIISGDNNGYQATKGFDLASGLGSINGTVLEQHLMSNVPTVYITPNQLTFTTSTPKQLTVSKPGGVWSTSDTQICSVSANGLVTPGKKNGTCTIHNSYASNLVSVTVHLPQPTQPTKPVSTMEIIPFIAIGSTSTFGIETSSGTSNFTWTSSNPTVASVNSGLVTGIAAGSAEISVSDENKNTVSITVLVG